MKRRQIPIIMTLICSIFVANAQDSKPIVKSKQQVVKSQSNQTSNAYGTVTDIDGNEYKTVKIGNQIWMAENLKTSHYNDGTPIPNVTGDIEWKNLKKGAYCYYDNEIKNNAIYGKLYNWYAVNTGKLAPKGWHVPTHEEWTSLITYLGGKYIAGGKMKSISYWVGDDGSPFMDEKGNTIGLGLYSNQVGSNSSGFNGLPAGTRSFNDGSSYGIGIDCNFWSSTEYKTGFAWGYSLQAHNSYCFGTYYLIITDGISVRCIKD